MNMYGFELLIFSFMVLVIAISIFSVRRFLKLTALKFDITSLTVFTIAIGVIILLIDVYRSYPVILSFALFISAITAGGYCTVKTVISLKGAIKERIDNSSFYSKFHKPLTVLNAIRGVLPSREKSAINF